jgi:tRNA modification GTPase
MNSANDTIAAIATAPGESGVAVVRVSGPHSHSLLWGVFRSSRGDPMTEKGGTFFHGYIVSGPTHQEKLDEVIVLIFRKPRSYTREDVVEIHTHGGRVCAQRILRRILESGAIRLAEPGEFTKRAFLNGRIDLLQAEAVADLISARSDKAASSAMEQLTGSLTCSLTSIYENCISILGSVEGSLDFPEDEVPAPMLNEMRPELEGVSLEIEKLLATWDEGRFLREGALVVICGLPNAGKSTVFNSLLEVERAIVSEHPGTTRDFIEESMTLDGIPIRLVDTAGLRSSECSIETAGVKKSRELMGRADLFLYIIDGTLPVRSKDKAELAGLPREKVIIIVNKADLEMRVSSADFSDFICVDCASTSDELQAKVRNTILHSLRPGEGSTGAHISERHRALLISALSELQKAGSMLRSPPNDTLRSSVIPSEVPTLREVGTESRNHTPHPLREIPRQARDDGKAPINQESVSEQHKCVENTDLSLVAIHIRSALDSLGKITGKIYNKDLLDNIFQRFCIGK